MRKPLALLFVASLLASAGLGVWVLHLLRTDLGPIIDLKTALFTESVSDRGFFTEPPAELSRDGFSMDDSARIAAWRRRLSGEIPYLAHLDDLELPEDPVARAKAIALLFSAGANRNCGASSLMENVRRLPEGEGCCSDHTEVFLALTSVLGVVARETRQTEHTHNEIYDPTAGRWIWIDPQYALLARDPAQGRYLSLLELRDHYIQGVPFEFEFFGTPNHEFATRSPYEGFYYDSPEDFTDVYFVRGNNIFQQDDFRASLGFLPKPAWQLAGMLVGSVPGFVIYSDAATSRPAELERLKVGAITLVLVLGLGLLGYPSYLVVHAVRRRRAEPRGEGTRGAQPLEEAPQA